MKIDFVLFVCLYPVCMTAARYFVTVRYKLLGWDYFQKKTESQWLSVADTVIWIVVSALLYRG